MLFGKALLAVVFSFLIPGAGLVYLGRAVLGSVFALGTVLAALIGVLVPGFLPPTAGAYFYLAFLVLTGAAWLVQCLLTLWGAVALARGEVVETRLPMAVAIVFCGTAAFLACGGLRARYGVAPFVVPSVSMKPTLIPGDRILALPLREGTAGEALRGKLVLHRVTTPENAEGIVHIKRVVAVGGDRVVVKADCSVFVNDKPLPAPAPNDEPVAVTPCAPTETTLPAGKLFVLADNLAEGLDSRRQGPIDEATVLGQPFVVWFSRSPGGPTHWDRLGKAVE